MPENSPIPATPIIESASATTSPDNSNSGPFAYVITVVAVGALLLLVTSLTSFASTIGQAAIDGGLGLGQTYDPYYDHYLEDEYDGYDDFVPYDLERVFGDDVTETVLS